MGSSVAEPIAGIPNCTDGVGISLLIQSRAKLPTKQWIHGPSIERWEFGSSGSLKAGSADEFNRSSLGVDIVSIRFGRLRLLSALS